MSRLFLLRPEPGASASAARARAMGVEVVVAPLFAVGPVAWDTPDADAFDALLLTSANAVRHAGPGLAALRHLPVHAVGAATAEAARAVGLSVVGTGSGNAADLVATISADMRLLHLCGRDVAEATRATPVTVYAAEELPAPDALATLDDQVAAIHSPRAARRLAALAGEGLFDRARVTLVAISPAAAAAAGLGWKMVVVAPAPSDSAVLACAARLCQD